MSTCLICGKHEYGYVPICICNDCTPKGPPKRPDEPPPPLPSIQAAESPIPPKYQWSKYDEPLLEQRVIKGLVAINASTKWVAGRAVLHGGAGVGKTSLACAMLRASMERNPRRSHLFVGAYYLAKARWQHRFGQGEAPLVERALNCHVLVLDDVGIEQAQNTAVEEVIYERHAEDKSTIITTGFGLEQLAKRYGDGIARRIYEGATVIKCG